MTNRLWKDHRFTGQIVRSGSGWDDEREFTAERTGNRTGSVEPREEEVILTGDIYYREDVGAVFKMLPGKLASLRLKPLGAVLLVIGSIIIFICVGLRFFRPNAP